jgi:hypothetical protein
VNKRFVIWQVFYKLSPASIHRTFGSRVDFKTENTVADPAACQRILGGKYIPNRFQATSDYRHKIPL